MNPGQGVRSLLAMAGGDLRLIDKSYKENEQGDYSGNRNRANINAVENADYSIRQRLGMVQPQSQFQPQLMMNYPIYPEQNIQFMNYQPAPPKPSREERINKLLGKNSTPVQQVVVPPSDEYAMIVEAVKEALISVTEQLEDIAVLNGLLVQRLEKLINVVDPAVNFDEAADIQGPSFQSEEPQMEQQMEVYDPEVSMSLTDDEEDVPKAPVKKKRKTTK